MYCRGDIHADCHLNLLAMCCFHRKDKPAPLCGCCLLVRDLLYSPLQEIGRLLLFFLKFTSIKDGYCESQHSLASV